MRTGRNDHDPLINALLIVPPPSARLPPPTVQR
jgi:hypothetical protein